MLTIGRHFGRISGITVAYLGDANNVARSLALAVGMLGGRVRIASPLGYGMGPEDLDRLALAGVRPQLSHRVEEAVEGADVVYTDVWTSMGQEAEKAARHRAFEGFGIDEQVMSLASPEAVFMHCLPAHRGEEVAPAVVDACRKALEQVTEAVAAAWKVEPSAVRYAKGVFSREGSEAT
ncbi:MAG TPA: ornithine carbamoyltransferase, partial [Phycisphaerae bacterium]|nr:ornithine carbamoyltransferase [Phycisphaerae bacterium]